MADASPRKPPAVAKSSVARSRTEVTSQAEREISVQFRDYCEVGQQPQSSATDQLIKAA